MSVVGKSVGDTTPVTAYQPVSLVSPTTGAPGAISVAGTVPVSGPLTNAQFVAALAGAAYTDETGAAAGSIASLLKGIYVQLAIIAENTAPA